MAEEGINIAAETPKILTTEAVKDSEVVVTMGCGDTQCTQRMASAGALPTART